VSLLDIAQLVHLQAQEKKPPRQFEPVGSPLALLFDSQLGRSHERDTDERDTDERDRD
jgi:hypothetical protein